jgi:hypothetical protein
VKDYLKMRLRTTIITAIIGGIIFFIPAILVKNMFMMPESLFFVIFAPSLITMFISSYMGLIFFWSHIFLMTLIQMIQYAILGYIIGYFKYSSNPQSSKKLEINSLELNG